MTNHIKRNMNQWEEYWLNWYKNGIGLDNGNYTPKQILTTAKSIDFNSFITDAGCLDVHAVLREIIHIRNMRKKKAKRISKGYRETTHPQRTEKGFFNKIVRRG